ncbi:MAG: amidohydrolase family protein [Candidatus Thorarchaeota archaeon]
MFSKQINCDYGLIGDNLEIKKNIKIEISKNGKINKISYENIDKSVIIAKSRPTYLLIPGLINSHIHIGDSFAKEEGFNNNLIDIVAPPNGLKHRLLKSTPEENIIEGIYKASREMISNGTTFFVDFRENELDGINLLRNALKGSSINYLVLGRFNDIRDLEGVYNAADGIGFVSYKYLSQNIKEQLKKLKNVKKKIFACHDAENFRDRNVFEKILNDKIIDVIVHGTKYIEEDLIEIKKNNIALVICPRSNGYFGIGFPPINEILNLNLPISIGTDNVMANNLDLFEELRYIYRIYRVLRKDSNAPLITAKDLLKMITINAAMNFGLESEIGSISKEKFADFFMIDLNDPNLYLHKIDKENIYPIIVQRTKSENIKQVYIRGDLIFERI